MADLTAYSIDIAARMTGQETFAELDRLTSTLSGAGKGAEHFDRAVQTLSGKLKAAGAANATAQEKLASGQARYRELETSLNRASKAAERAAKKNEGIVPFDFAAQVAAAESALDAHSMTLQALEKDATGAAKAEKALAGQLQGVRTMAAHVDKRMSLSAERLSQLQSGLSSTGTWAGRLGSSLLGPVKGYTDLTQVVGKTNAVLLVSVSVAVGAATAIAALGVAAVVAAVGLTALVVGVANMRRDTALAREAAEALHPELAALRGDIDTISGSTGLAGGKIRELAAQLKAAKVSAADMPAALRAMATAEAAVAGGGAAFVAELKKGDKAVSVLAAETQAKFGGIVERKMLSLGALGARLKGNLGGLFDDLDIEPVLRGLRTLIDLFDKNSATGKAMQAILGGVFQPLIDHAQEAAWVIEAVVLGLGIGFLKAYIKLKPTMKAIAKALDIDTSDMDLEDTLAGISKAAEKVAPVVMAMAVASGIAAAVVGALGTALTVLAGILALPAILTGAAIVGVVLAIKALPGIVSKAWTALKASTKAIGESIASGLSAAGKAVAGFAKGAATLGTAIIDGLVSGITSGAKKVSAALTGAVTGALGSAKAALGISSPSTVAAAELAEPIVAGTEGKLDRESHRVRRAMVDMVAPPEVPEIVTPLQSLQPGGPGAGAVAYSPAAAAQSAQAASGGVTVDLSGATLTFNGVADAPSGIDRFKEMLTRALEGDALAVGAG